MLPARLEPAEIAGWRDTWSAAPEALRARFGIAHLDHHGVLATTVTTLVNSLTTHVLGLGGGAPPDPGALEAVEGFCRDHGVPAVLALPDGAPAEAALQARGYVRTHPWIKFVRDIGPAARVDCELAIRPVAGGESARMGQVIAGAFGVPRELSPWFAALVGRPGWHCLGAYDGAELVATGGLWVHGDTGWLTWGATEAAHRGRRAQKALLAARIELGRDLDLRLLVTETGDRGPGRTDNSYRNILGAGFRIAYRRPFWTRELSS